MLEAAARFLEPRARSVTEVRRRLTGAGYRTDLVEGAITRMLELGMLDDEAFARAWVESRDRARPRGERAIRDELSDRFGPLPPSAENLLKLQRARIELGLAGARSVEFRGGRLSVTGVELDSEGAGVLAEQVEGALYEWREQTAAVRVAGDPEERLAAVLAMAEGLREARRAGEAAAA